MIALSLTYRLKTNLENPLILFNPDTTVGKMYGDRLFQLQITKPPFNYKRFRVDFLRKMTIESPVFIKKFTFKLTKNKAGPN